MGWNRDCLAVPLCSWAPAGLHFLTSLTVKCGHVTEFWPLIWEQKWWMLLPDLAYKNFTHGPPLSPFSYLLTECWGSRWSWESYVENVKALISLNSLVNAGSKPSPPFLWFQLNFEWEIQYLVLSHGDFTVYLLIQCTGCCLIFIPAHFPKLVWSWPRCELLNILPVYFFSVCHSELVYLFATKIFDW